MDPEKKKKYEEIRRKVAFKAIDAGAGNFHYHGFNKISLSMPNNSERQDIIAMMKENGFDLIDSAYIPIGSDNPPLIMRHHNKYTDMPPGFYLFDKFRFNGKGLL